MSESNRTEHQVDALIGAGVLEIGDGYRAKNSELDSTGMPFARAGNLNAGFDFSSADRVPPRTLDRVGNKRSQPGDVVFTSKGTVGRFAQVEESTEPFVYSPQLCFWRVLDDSVIDPRFLYYWMQGPESARQLNALKGQTDMADYVSLRDQRAMTISLPPIEEQRCIASMLSTLDRKIESNRRVAALAEELAATIFRSWFVDFDPVHAKAAGLAPVGVPDEVVDLLPDSFEDSEIGLIPAGWRARPIGELVTVVGGGTPSTKDEAFWSDSGHPWATPKDLASLETKALLGTARHVSDAGLAKISSGLLPAGTILLSSRAPIGYLAVAEEPVAINQGFIGMKCEGVLTNHFALQWASAHIDEIKARANGTTFLEISKRNFRPIPVCVPEPEIMNAFQQIAEALYSQVVSATRESMTLADLRNALLPKLVSGQIRVEPGEAQTT